MEKHRVQGKRIYARFPVASIDSVTQLTSGIAQLLAEYRDVGGDLADVQITVNRPAYLGDQDRRIELRLDGYAP